MRLYVYSFIRLFVYTLKFQPLNLSTSQRINVSTPQRLNPSTNKRINASTSQRINASVHPFSMLHLSTSAGRMPHSTHVMAAMILANTLCPSFEEGDGKG